MEIFDARCRPPIAAFWNDTMYNLDRTGADAQKRGASLAPSAKSRSLELFFDEMRVAGVIGAAVPGRTANPISGSANNELIFDLCDKYDQFLAVPAISSFTSDDGWAEIAEFKAAGAKAIAVEAGLAETPLYIDDRSLYPLYEMCDAAELPVYVMVGGNAGPDLTYCNPVGLDRIARDFPAVTFVAIHAGWPRVQETLGVAYRRTNVWLLPDHYFPDLPGSTDLISAIGGYLQDRFLFGTAFPYHSLEFGVWQHLNLPLTETVVEKIMCANAKRLFGLS